MRDREGPPVGLCATGFIGSGQVGLPHLHLGGDALFVVGAAIALVLLTVWAYRRWGASVTPSADPALAEAVDEVYAGLDDELVPDDTRELVEA